jgi:hypothetical protein
MTTTDLNPPSTPFWMPNGCPSWCVWTDSHKDGDHPDDRTHYSADESVEATLEPPVEYIVPSAPGDSEYRPQRVGVDIRQLESQAAPEVRIYEEDRPEWVKLTPVEARDLGETLIRVARLAGGDTPT